jgi:hypothetical protein
LGIPRPLFLTSIVRSMARSRNPNQCIPLIFHSFNSPSPNFPVAMQEDQLLHQMPQDRSRFRSCTCTRRARSKHRSKRQVGGAPNTILAQTRHMILSVSEETALDLRGLVSYIWRVCVRFQSMRLRLRLSLRTDKSHYFWMESEMRYCI